MAGLPSFKSRRSPTQNAIIAFLVIFASFVAFGFLPTQWFAAQYQYDPNLGEPLLRVAGIAIYLPTDWVSWGWRLADIEVLKSNVHVMLMLGTFSFVLAILFGVFVSHLLGRYTDGMDGLHGTAHWAEAEDVNNTGFVPRKARLINRLLSLVGLLSFFGRSAKNYVSVGVIIGSVMYDRKNQIIHPHHKLFAKRYIPLLKNGEPVLDDANRPIYKPNPKVVKRIELLKDGANTHLFAFCPTRSGKGTGMITPTLVTYPNSVMVNDPKGEAYNLTGGFRKAAGQEVVKFEPACTNGTGARWNPLDEIRVYTHFDVSDAQMIMSMACDPKGEGLDDYFDKAGYEFLTSLALHMRYAEKNGSLAGVAYFLGDPAWDSDKQMYTHMMQATHDPEGKMNWKDSMGKPTKTHPMVANAAKTMLNKEDKDRSGVLSTAKSLLSLYLDPIVAMNTGCSDFLVRDLMTGKKPVSLYYVVGPADMERLVPLTRLFYALFIRRNAAEMEFEGGRSKKTYTYPLLMIIDEASSLKKLPILQEALGYVAGYGIRMFVLVQDIVQLEELYGDKQSFDSGAETRIAYAPNKIETAEKLARMTGKTTVTEENASNSRDVIGIKAGSVSLSTSKTARDLMTADEFASLSNSDVIIFVKGMPPIYGRKAYFFENPVMAARAKMVAPEKSSILRIAKEIDDVIEVVEVVAPVETSGDKWAASRVALADRVVAQVAPVAVVAPVATTAVNGSEDVVVITQPAARRSRYAGRVATMSAEEKAQVQSLVANVALVDKVVGLRAF